jgi:hypothetical protein
VCFFVVVESDRNIETSALLATFCARKIGRRLASVVLSSVVDQRKMNVVCLFVVLFVFVTMFS